MITRNPFLSIIIPVYNESNRLGHILSLYKFIRSQKFKSELIIVNDGSTDNTLKRLESLKEKNRFNIISYRDNKGKGYAVRMGMLQAKGRYCLFTDIDFSTPIEAFNKLAPWIKKYDVVIGSRKMIGAKLINRQPFVRESLGRGFTILSKLILGLNLSDFTCGFKCFSKKATMDIFSRQKINRWGFDSEILFIAKIKNFKIKEVPVEWSNDQQTKVKFPDDLISSLFELLLIRYYNFKHFYK